MCVFEFDRSNFRTPFVMTSVTPSPRSSISPEALNQAGYMECQKANELSGSWLLVDGLLGYHG
jgi:hypothetical protein